VADIVALFDTVEVRVCAYTPSQIALNVLHYLCLSVSSAPPDYTMIAIAFDTLFATNYKNFLGGNAAYRGVTAKRLTSIQSIQYPAVGGAGPAAGGATVCPTQVAGLITIRTRFGGSGYRGRVFLPFPASSYLATTGAPGAPIIALMGNIALSMGPSITITGGAGSSCILQQVIRKRGGILTNDPQVIGYTVQPKFATQRRRGQYGQPNVLPF